MATEPDGYGERVLSALAEGYRAREGMKEKWRALNEYEIARRIGVTQYTYAGFDTSPERIELRNTLDQLLRQGLVEISGASGRYDTFAPVEQPERPQSEALEAVVGQDQSTTEVLERISQQLDDALLVLRSIDRKLGPD
jgi:hypothetical protein